MLHFWFELISISIVFLLFLGMLLFLELGRRIGQRQIALRGKDARVGVGIVDSAVYGLLALLIGFTFSGAAGRFDRRRDLVAQEANAASTAWIRVDLLPTDAQAVVRDGFRRYMDALIAWYSESSAKKELTTQPEYVTAAQGAVWSSAVAACLTPSGERARMLLLPSFNELFDVVDTERAARRMHPPLVIWMMLGITAFAAALFVGYGISNSPKRNWVYIIGFSASVSIATYVILELEFPRLGFARVRNEALVELRAQMK